MHADDVESNLGVEERALALPPTAQTMGAIR